MAETGTEVETRAGAFTPETASAAGKLSAAARARRRLERLKLEDLVDVLAELGDVATIREDLRSTAFAGALILASKLAAGQVPTGHAHYVATAIEKLTNVARLESGEATSVGVNVTGGPGDWQSWLQGLRSDAETTAQPTDSHSAPASGPAIDV